MNELNQFNKYAAASRILSSAQGASPKNFYNPESSSVEPIKNGLRAVHPGELISDFLEEGQSGYGLARRLGQPVKTVKAILAKKMLPSVEFYIAMSQEFDISIQFWVNIHNAFVAKKISAGSRWYSHNHMLDMTTVEWQAMKPVGMEIID